MENHLEKLEELIKDENNIVTVASFALLENINVEESQKVLDKYEEINKGSEQLLFSYIIHGIKKNPKEYALIQANDHTLESAKNVFEGIPAVKVYSIQKGKTINYNIISLVKQKISTKEEPNLLALVVGKNCVKRVPRKKILPPLPPSTIKGKSTIFSKQNSSIKSDSNENLEVKNEPASNTNSKTNKNNSSSNTLQNMFSKMPPKTNIKKEKPEQKPKPNGLSSFLTQQPSKESNKQEIKVEISSDNELNDSKKAEFKEECGEYKKDTKGILTNKSDLFDSDTDEEIAKTEIQEKKAKENPHPKQNARSSNKKKREKEDVGKNKSIKKRKRIIVEDSDDDDIFGSEKEDDEGIVEKSYDEPEPAKVEPKVLPPKNKRRKAVKKTYEDEDGYIVTQTEYVYETASEDENEPDNKLQKKEEPVKQSIEKKKSTENVSPNKGAKKGSKKAPPTNQPTLMNFFRKK